MPDTSSDDIQHQGAPAQAEDGDQESVQGGEVAVGIAIVRSVTCNGLTELQTAAEAGGQRSHSLAKTNLRGTYQSLSIIPFN